MLTYDELMEREDAPPGSAWGLFGPDDQAGTLNHLTPERVAAAAGLVRKGVTFNLDYPLNVFNPYPSGTREPTVHRIFAHHPNHRDDYLDSFYLQSTTQLDGFRHIRHPVHGFYNWTSDDDIVESNPALGIQHWAERGITGRGVLLDVERFLADAGDPIDQDSSHPIGLDVLTATAESCGVTVEPGDILLIRTGWTRYFLEHVRGDDRARFPQNIRCPGLAQTRELVAWLWDSRIAVVAMDNFAVEALPPIPDSPFTYPDPETGSVLSPELEGKIHPQLIALLGMPIGEMWYLDDLAADCAHDGVYEFFVTAKPLNVIGGVGSPSNALAFK